MPFTLLNGRNGRILGVHLAGPDLDDATRGAMQAALTVGMETALRWLRRKRQS